MINLSVTPQVCAREDGTVEVHAFVSRYQMPPGPIRVTLNGVVVADLEGQTVHTHYLHVGLGAHTLRAEADGHVAERSFSVWHCK